MTQSLHKIHIETVFATDLLQLPVGVEIKEAGVIGDDLVLTVVSDHNLGEYKLTAIFGSIDDEDRVHLGMLEPLG